MKGQESNWHLQAAFDGSHFYIAHENQVLERKQKAAVHYLIIYRVKTNEIMICYKIEAKPRHKLPTSYSFQNGELPYPPSVFSSTRPYKPIPPICEAPFANGSQSYLFHQCICNPSNVPSCLDNTRTDSGFFF